MGERASGALAELYRANNPRHRARAFWLLARLEDQGRSWTEKGLRDVDADMRIAALRAVRMHERDVTRAVKKLLDDPSRAVLRECAIALRGLDGQASALWAELALKHDGKDRWFLEALGIGADGHWDERLGAWLARVGDGWNTAAGRDIIWRSRASNSLELLERVIASGRLGADELPRFFRALDFLESKQKNSHLARLAFTTAGKDQAATKFISSESLRRLKWVDRKNGELVAALDRALANVEGSEFVELVARFDHETRYPDLLSMALEAPDSQTGVEATRALLSKGRIGLFKEVLDSGDVVRSAAAARALGSAADARLVDVLLPILRDEERPTELRRQAARALARVEFGARKLIALAREEELDEGFRHAAAFELNRAPWRDLHEDIAALFPLPTIKNDEKLPPIANLVKMRGSTERGREVYEREDTCIQCHQVDGKGKYVGPDLSEIGSKLGREALYESILFPSAGISHDYESWLVTLKSGEILTGLITSETPESITLKAADALVREIRASDVRSRAKQETSLMPADLQKLMSTQDLADLVAYLVTLKKK